MKHIKLYKTLSIITAAAVGFAAYGVAADDAPRRGGGGPGTALCDGTGPGEGLGVPRFDGRGGGEGRYLRGQKEPRMERKGEARGTPRLDGRGPRHELGPRLGRNDRGQRGEGIQARDGSGEGAGPVNRQARDGSGEGAGPMNRNQCPPCVD